MALEIKQSASQPLEKQRLVLLGQPGEGKTFAAASFSEYFDPTFSKAVDLKDMLWFRFDSGGLDGLTERRINVPNFDFTAVEGEKELASNIKDGLATAQRLALAGSTKCIVIDTMSMLDKTWMVYAYQRLGKTFDTHYELVAKHRQFYDMLRPLACHAILTMHIKAKSEKDNDNSELRGFTQVMDLNGQNGNIYRGHASVLAPVRRTDTKGKPSEYHIHPRGFGGSEGKTRYACLADKETANLQEIYKKITTAMSPTENK